MLGRNIDLKNSLKIARSISPQSIAAAATVNLSGTDADTLVYIQTFVRAEGYVRATATVAVDAIILGVNFLADKDVL